MTAVLRNKRAAIWAICAAALALSGAGCRQRMADQPYYRPLEESEFFPDGRASPPLERGTVHRAQYLDADPIATGLTAEEWGRSYEYGVPARLDQTKPDQPLSATELAETGQQKPPLRQRLRRHLWFMRRLVAGREPKRSDRQPTPSMQREMSHGR